MWNQFRTDEYEGMLAETSQWQGITAISYTPIFHDHWGRALSPG